MCEARCLGGTCIGIKGMASTGPCGSMRRNGPRVVTTPTPRPRWCASRLELFPLLPRQYPKEVCLALEERYRLARATASRLALEGQAAVERERSEQAWRLRLRQLPGRELRLVFGDEGEELVAEAAVDAGLREALLESALRQHAWPPSDVAEAL